MLIHGLAPTPRKTECFLQACRQQLGFLESVRFHEDLWLGDADDRLPLMLLVGGQRAISEGYTLGLLGARKRATGRYY